MIRLIKPDEEIHTFVLQDGDIHVFKGLPSTWLLIKYKTPYAVFNKHKDFISIELNGFNSDLEFISYIADFIDQDNLKNWFDNQKSLMNLYELTLGG